MYDAVLQQVLWNSSVVSLTHQLQLLQIWFCGWMESRKQTMKAFICSATPYFLFHCLHCFQHLADRSTQLRSDSFNSSLLLSDTSYIRISNNGRHDLFVTVWVAHMRSDNIWLSYSRFKGPPISHVMLIDELIELYEICRGRIRQSICACLVSKLECVTHD